MNRVKLTHRGKSDFHADTAIPSLQIRSGRRGILQTWTCERWKLSRRCYGPGMIWTTTLYGSTKTRLNCKGFMVCSPPVHTDCAKCAYQRRIVEYGIIGKLAEHPLPKPKPVEKPQPTSEEINAKKLRRLQRIESDVARLQAEAEKLRADIHISKEGTE